MKAVREWKELHNKKFIARYWSEQILRPYSILGIPVQSFCLPHSSKNTSINTHKIIICVGVKLGVSYYGKNTECGRLTIGRWEEETAFADF